MRVQIAFYFGSDEWWHKVIRFVTRSPMSHCEVVLDGQGYTPKHGHSSLYQRDPAEYQNGEWKLVTVDWHPLDVKTFLEAHAVQRYDLRSLLAHFLPIHDSVHGQNCSEFLVNMASYCRDPRFHNRAAWRFSPGDIYKVLRG